LTFPHEVSPAQDAEVVLGSGPGAVTLRRPSNVVQDLLPGVTLALAGPGTVTVTVEQDLEAVKKAVRDFAAAYNDVTDALTRYGRYDPETKQRGALQGDGTLQRIQAQLPDAVLRTEVADQTLRRLSDLGGPGGPRREAHRGRVEARRRPAGPLRRSPPGPGGGGGPSCGTRWTS
jgi:flagellar capping protein FliD